MAKSDSLLAENSLETLKQRKRSRAEIYSDVLSVLCEEVAKRKRLSLTRVANRVNMPYDRLKALLEYLSDTGLCEHLGSGFAVTVKGMEFLDEYRRFDESLSRMGLEL